ncbi:MAG: hypothetical protein QY331_10695 [Melioribacteraceae bacterium]|jgi:hypothetical protein|nr:MAG: hypothetical protein QY331_10695 [Melioribacteraceae bacterium]
MKKYLPSLVAGFGAGVLSVVPVLKSFACCLIVPAAAYLSIVLYQRANNLDERIETGKAIFLGLFTGLFAALFTTSFEIIITLFTKQNDLIEAFGNLQGMINSFPIDDAIKQQVIDMMNDVVVDLRTKGFSFLYSITLLFNNLLVDIIFGIVGGVIGLQVTNAKYKNR